MTPNPSPAPRPSSPPLGDVELLERLAAARADLLAQVERRIVGQKDVLDGILTAVFSGGHALLVGVPGLAKALMVQTVAQTLDLKFSRIQFTPVLTAEDVLALQHLVRRIPVSKALVRAAVTLVRMTRPPDAEAPPFIKEFISWGAGPRASQYLILGAKARAALDGRPMPDEDDLRAVAPTVLTHRLVINFAAEAAGRTAPDIITQLLVTGKWAQG